MTPLVRTLRIAKGRIPHCVSLRSGDKFEFYWELLLSSSSSLFTSVMYSRSEQKHNTPTSSCRFLSQITLIIVLLSDIVINADEEEINTSPTQRKNPRRTSYTAAYNTAAGNTL